MTSSHTASASLSAAEARVLRLARDGLETIRANDNNANFCVGSAWKTLELILEVYGETIAPPPWNEVSSDEHDLAGGGK